MILEIQYARKQKNTIRRNKNMPLVTTKEMFEKSMKEHYAIGAFNVNNMEIIQGIMDAAKEQ